MITYIHIYIYIYIYHDIHIYSKRFAQSAGPLKDSGAVVSGWNWCRVGFVRCRVGVGLFFGPSGCWVLDGLGFGFFISSWF